MPVSTVSIPVGQWFTSAEGTRWWFDSGSFALDFAYTGAMGGNPAWERLHAPDDLTTWLRERFPVAVGVARSRDLFDAISLREAIGRMAQSAAHGEPARAADIDLVNLYAATPDIPPVARRRVAPGRPLGADRRPGALDDRARRGRPLRSRERRPHPRVQRQRLRDRLPRHVPRGHAPLVLDAALRQPREGARAPGSQGGAGGGLTSPAGARLQDGARHPAPSCAFRVRRGRPRRGVRARPGTRRARSRIAHPPGSPARRARPRCPTRR